MEFSTNWIQDYVDFPEGGVEEFAARMTAAADCVSMAPTLVTTG